DAARQAAAAREAQRARDRRLPAVAGIGAGGDQAGGAGLPGRDRRPGAVGQELPGDEDAGPGAAARAGTGDGDGASVVDLAGARRRDAAPRDGALGPRPAQHRAALAAVGAISFSYFARR